MKTYKIRKHTYNIEGTHLGDEYLEQEYSTLEEVLNSVKILIEENPPMQSIHIVEEYEDGNQTRGITLDRIITDVDVQEIIDNWEAPIE